MDPENYTPSVCPLTEERRRHNLAVRAEAELDALARAAAAKRHAKKFRMMEQRRNGEPTWSQTY